MKQCLFAATVSLMCGAAQAYSCSLVVTNIGLLYSPTTASAIVSTGNFNFTCSRTMSEPDTLNWDLAAGNGFQPSGVLNRVQLGTSTNRYNYELYRNPTYSNPNRWQLSNALRFTGTLNFGSALIASQPATPFYLRVPANQTARPAGVYTDTVEALLRVDGSNTNVIGTTNFNVTVTTLNECRLTTPPGNVVFNYQSFQTTAATAVTTFETTCTPDLRYDLEIEPAPNVLLGLNYGLTVSSTSATGTGMAQSHAINGSISGGQAGSCTSILCVDMQVRTLKISY
jgi:hypothetical protein